MSTGRSSLETVVTRARRAVDFSSIRTHILGFALLAALIPSLSTAWISYTQTKRSLTERIAEELQGVSSQASREIDLWLKERFYDTRVFAVSFEVSENITNRAAGDRLRDYLVSVQDRFRDFFEELLVVRPTGVIATSHPADSVSIPEEWLTGTRNDPTIVSPAYWDGRLAKVILPISVPITAADGQFLGALLAKLDLTGMQAILRDFSPSDSGQMLLLAEDGSVVFSSLESSAQLMRAALEDRARESLLAAGASAVEFVNYEGTPSIGTARVVPRSPWVVVAEIPTSEAFARVRRLTNLMLLITTGIIVVVSFVAYHLGLLIVRPLDRLRQGAAEVASGDLAVELPIESGGEVGDLTEVFNDMVRRLQKGRDELERLSITDGLTGLYNRRHMMNTIESEVARTKRLGRGFTVIMLDVDHFKGFNDDHGHQAGDAVLAKIAEILRKVTRAVDYTARYGGEEFLMILPETKMERAEPVAERIRSRLSRQKFDVGGSFASVTASLGMAEFPADGKSATAVIGAADAALYEAKRAGRDRVMTAKREETPQPAEG